PLLGSKDAIRRHVASWGDRGSPYGKRAAGAGICQRGPSCDDRGAHPAITRTSPMKYRKLGASDLNVSEISLGSWLTYGVGVEKDKALACIDRSFELGINFIDTANVYGRGAAETVLGEALANRKRDSYILATKVFGDMGGRNQGLSRAQIEKQLDASLKRLRTDFVDLYQCHRYDPNTPLEETMEALSRAVKSGKVRWLGFSEWAPDQIEASIAMKGVE